MTRRLGTLIILILALAGCGRDASPPAAQSMSSATESQLAVFLSRTTSGDFTVAQADSATIPGFGDGAFSRDGHLYVLVGTTQVDVYARGGDEQQSQAEAEKVAGTLVPKVRAFS
jgi:hypothetical protein